MSLRRRASTADNWITHLGAISAPLYAAFCRERGNNSPKPDGLKKWFKKPESIFEKKHSGIAYSHKMHLTTFFSSVASKSVNPRARVALIPKPQKEIATPMGHFGRLFEVTLRVSGNYRAFLTRPAQRRALARDALEIDIAADAVAFAPFARLLPDEIVSNLAPDTAVSLRAL